MRFYTILLAALIGLTSFQVAEAATKHPKPQHSTSHKIKNKKFKNKKFKKAKFKRTKR